MSFISRKKLFSLMNLSLIHTTQVAHTTQKPHDTASEEASEVSGVNNSGNSEWCEVGNSEENDGPPRPHPLCHPDANWVKDDLLGVFTCEVCNHG